MEIVQKLLMADESEETLTLNDGTVFGNHSHARESGKTLFVYISDGSGIREVFEALIEPEKTSHIEYLYYGATLVFNGYTKVISVTDEGDGLITAILKKEAATDEQRD